MRLTNNTFKNIINKNYTFEDKPLIAVGVSGGPDSLALLFLIKSWLKNIDGKVIALIVDHNLRSESLKEAKFIQKEINKNKIESKILKIDNSKIKKRSMSEARDNRYEVLTDYCRKKNILHLFVAHHNDDNLETFINRKIAGSDFEGLQSLDKIVTKNYINVMRPLLDFSKEEIYKYANANKIKYIEDPSNNNYKYTRPIIRKYLKEIKKEIKEDIINDFNLIRNNIKKYNLMISEILIDIILVAKDNYILIQHSKILKHDELIAEKIIKKIYSLLNQNKDYLRSVKIQLLLNMLRDKKFSVFNLKGMYIKKNNKYLEFSLKTD